jgi:hypothetical protein
MVRCSGVDINPQVQPSEFRYLPLCHVSLCHVTLCYIMLRCNVTLHFLTFNFPTKTVHNRKGQCHSTALQQQQFLLSNSNAMAQAVRCWSLAVEDWVCFHTSASGICGGQSGTETGFCPSILVYPCHYIPPMLHTHSLIHLSRMIYDFSSWQSPYLTQSI